jgi:U3 small nucleolar ribonucleoprotein protein IMP4
LRRLTRLRKEYVYRRSLEGKDRIEYEKKKRIKENLEKGTPIPTELRDDVNNLESSIAFEDDKTFVDPENLDSEYAKGGYYDPKIMVTSSRNPSSRLVQFIKELNLIFPGATRMNRGGHKIPEIIGACRRNGYTDLIIVHETRGIPDGLVISHLPYGPTAYFGLYNVVMRHDIEEGLTNMSTQDPHLIFNNFNTKLGKRVQTIMKFLFPPAKEESTRVLTFSNEDDFIAFRHHTFKKVQNEIELIERGPRFEMRLYKILLGTLDMKEAETEWVLHSFLNTAKRRTYL